MTKEKQTAQPIASLEILPVNLRIKGEFPSEYDASEATEIVSQVIDLLTVNWSQIKKINDENGGKTNISFSCAIDHTNPDKRYVQVAISFSRKYKDESEIGAIEDPTQPKLDF